MAKKTIKARLDELESGELREKTFKVIHQSLEDENLYYLPDAPEDLMTKAAALEKIGDYCEPIWMIYTKNWREDQ